jgi:formyltetrahydrofolate deformylase
LNDKNPTAVLLFSCRDRIGLVSRISRFVSEHGGNITDLDEHVDVDERVFFVRLVWDIASFTLPSSEVGNSFAALAEEYNAAWEIHFTETRSRVALLVSRYDHCLQELLWRQHTGELAIDIPLIISNHVDLKSLADHYGIPYRVFPVMGHDKEEQERQELELLKSNRIDTVVLARYMQILSDSFIDAYPNRIINIHHSFLPAFIGSRPYHQAYERGVKIIGATSHYVTKTLDDGPIIEQDVVRISHRDTVKDLIRKGRDLERMVLARALYHHTEHRILVHGNKTIIFE